ncbi:hypothetical protein NUSPORA_00295 [Nucleospora cyclopteri]
MFFVPFEMFLLFLLSLINCFDQQVPEQKEIAKLIFENFDFVGAYKEIKEHEEFSPIKYWFYKRFLNFKADAAALLFTTEMDNMVKTVICRETISEFIRINNDTLTELALDVADDIAREYTKNKFNFEDIIVLGKEQIKNAGSGNSYNKKEVLILLQSNQPKIKNLFFSMLENKEISLEEAKPYLYKIAKQDSRAYKLLGDIAYYGLDTKGNVPDWDQAMDFYWAGSEKNNGDCLTGLGKIMLRYYDNAESATAYFEKALDVVDAPESMFIYYKMTNKHTFLRKAAYKGYIPAMAEYFRGQAEKMKELDERGRRSVLSILKYHPHFMEITQQAKKAFYSKKYAQAFLLYSYLSEFSIENALLNAKFIIDNFKEELEIINTKFNELMVETARDGIDKINNHPFVDVLNFDFSNLLCSINNNFLKDVGDCYFYGTGIDQSYADAFSFYLRSKDYSPESAYNLVCMYEYGLGIPQNYKEAYDIFSHSFLNNMKFLKLIYKTKLLVKMFMNSNFDGVLLKIICGIVSIIVIKLIITVSS